MAEAVCTARRFSYALARSGLGTPIAVVHSARRPAGVAPIAADALVEAVPHRRTTEAVRPADEEDTALLRFMVARSTVVFGRA